MSDETRVIDLEQKLSSLEDLYNTMNEIWSSHVAQLENALRPFAEYAKRIPESEPNDSVRLSGTWAKITCGDLRQAAKALWKIWERGQGSPPSSLGS